MSRKYKGLLPVFMTAVLMIWSVGPVTAVEDITASKRSAVVSGAVITQEDLDREVGLVIRRLQREGQVVGDSELGEVKKNVLEGLINKELIYQESKKTGFEVERSILEDRLKAMKARFPDEAQFKAALAGMSLSEKTLMEQIEKGLAIQHLIDEKFARKIIVSESETRAFYDTQPDLFKRQEELNASHILIKVSQDADASQKASAKKKIQNIQKRLENGEDFAVLAKALSEGPSAPRGGDLGYFTRGRMVPPFDKAAFALKKGEVSDVVETQFGYHLIKVIDRKPEGKIAYEEIEERLKNHLIQAKVQKEVEQYVKDLKERVKVERFPFAGP
jgi:peptidyl-prolyl cis-trans isomerase C